MVSSPKAAGVRGDLVPRTLVPALLPGETPYFWTAMVIEAAPDYEALLRDLAVDGQLVHVERIPARSARTAALTDPLPGLLAERLPPDGLWTHQAAAVDLARGGRSVAVATGTESGKSLC